MRAVRTALAVIAVASGLVLAAPAADAATLHQAKHQISHRDTQWGG